jgi:small subunit ribosomal protein S5
MLRATFAALETMMSPRSVAARRGKKVSDIFGRRRGEDEAAASN